MVDYNKWLEDMKYVFNDKKMREHSKLVPDPRKYIYRFEDIDSIQNID